MSSRWCPWELGYADGVKTHERIIMIPTQDGYASYGSEYLDLYTYIRQQIMVLQLLVQGNRKVGHFWKICGDDWHYNGPGRGPHFASFRNGGPI
jgi:hypothetical protein